MSTSARDYLESQRKSKLQEAKAITDKVEAEGRSLAIEEKQNIEQLLKVANDIQVEIQDMDETDRMNENLQKMLGQGHPTESVDEPRSIGEAFVKSATYQDALKTGMFQSDGGWRTGAVEIDLDFKNTTHLDSDLPFGTTDVRPGVLPALSRRLMIADLIPTATTTMNAVSWVQEVSFDESDPSTQNAAEVAEGNEKPISVAKFTEVLEPVRTIATILTVSNQFLEDVNGVRTFLDGRLSNTVRNREDGQLLNGNGSAPNLSGILDRDIQTATQVSLADNGLDAVLLAISEVQHAVDETSDGGLEPTAIVMNPADWAQARLGKDQNDQYYGGGPFTAAYGNGQFTNVRDLWGYMAVVTSAIAEGTVLVGDFSAAQIFRRSGVTVEASNSHSDNFRRNLTTIRAEERLALGVRYPRAFFSITSADFSQGS